VLLLVLRIKFINDFLKELSKRPNTVRVIKSRRMRWAVQIACIGERRGSYKVLVKKSEVKRPLGRTRRRWENNIKMDLHEVGCGGYGLNRAGSGYGQVTGCCECGNEPSGSIKCGEFLDSLRTG
jgi:hypothetical protein